MEFIFSARIFFLVLELRHDSVRSKFPPEKKGECISCVSEGIFLQGRVPCYVGTGTLILREFRFGLVGLVYFGKVCTS